jgi:hypothetical protein
MANKNNANLKKALTRIVTGMAYSRDTWVDQARNRMKGALCEYAKLRLARMVSYDYNWEPEVLRLVKKIQELFDAEKTKTKTNFDKAKAFKEAFKEASSAQEQVVYALNKFEEKYLQSKKEIDLFKKEYRKNFDSFDSEKLLIDMLSEYLPNIVALLD